MTIMVKYKTLMFTLLLSRPCHLNSDHWIDRVRSLITTAVRWNGWLLH